jgi:hypothetical protein
MEPNNEIGKMEKLERIGEIKLAPEEKSPRGILAFFFFCG